MAEASEDDWTTEYLAPILSVAVVDDIEAAMSHIARYGSGHTDAILAFATISLALKVPRMSDPRAQQIAVVLWAAVLLGMYSFLLSIFRIKNGGYPFWLPPF